MIERLQKYALLAEIISAIAIVASLIFVGMQLKQNDKTNQVNAYQALTNASTDLLLLLAEDDKLFSLFLSANSGAELNNEDQFRLSLIQTSVIRQSELAFVQYKMGFIDELELQSLLNGLRRNINTPTMLLTWQNTPKSEDFEAYITSWLNMPELTGTAE